MKIITRKGKETDHGFVLATFIRSFPKLADRNVLMNHMRRALKRASLHVACSNEDTDTLVGWYLEEEGDPLWLYVSKDFRKLGVGKQLVKG